MEIIGRISANAKSRELTDGREVVNFSIAINESYKPKGASEIKKVVTYIDCSYWLSTAIATYLKKGALVQLSGSISAHAWKDLQGEPKASLNFHVNTIKVHGGGVKDHASTTILLGTVSEDLPF